MSHKDAREDRRAILYSKVILIFMGTFIILAVLIMLLVLTPGRWLMGFSATPHGSAQVGEPASFELCRSGPAIPRVVEVTRTVKPLGADGTVSGGVEYDFMPTIENEGCTNLNLFVSRIPQEPGNYRVTTNVFFSYLGIPKDTTYEFDFEYVE